MEHQGLVGYQGNSGIGGLSGITASKSSMPHDASLVEVVGEKIRKGRDINLVCPFAGKAFCFDQWKRSFKRLPIKRSHAVIYDNSNDRRFNARLRRVCDGLDSYTLVVDRNPQITTELSFDFAAIGARCRSVYGEIYNRLIDHKRPLSLNLEDDVTIPEGSFERLEHIIRQDRVATAIGQCNCRRALQAANVVQSIAVDFKVSQHLGSGQSIDIEMVQVQPKSFGVQQIGAGHMGLWLSRTDAIKSIGMGNQYGMLHGNDINWGFGVNAAGLRFAVDWSVKLDHHYQKDGQTLSC